MLFKYTHEINEETAKHVAKVSRANLIRSLIVQYRDLEKINQPVPDEQLTRTLRGILIEIESINTCSNTTTSAQEYLQTRIKDMQEHPRYVDIKEILDRGISELKNESNLAKDRARYITQNKINAIKNNAVYVGAAPTTLAVAGSILAVFSPLGWITLGIGVGMLILSELSFLLYHRTTLQQLNTNLEQGNLEADYGTGLAVPYEELPQVPQVPSPTRKDTLFGTTGDQAVEELFEIGGDLLADTRQAVVKSATSILSTAQKYVPTAQLYNMWSTVSTMANQLPTNGENNIDHFHML